MTPTLTSMTNDQTEQATDAAWDSAFHYGQGIARSAVTLLARELSRITGRPVEDLTEEARWVIRSML